MIFCDNYMIFDSPKLPFLPRWEGGSTCSQQRGWSCGRPACAAPHDMVAGPRREWCLAAGEWDGGCGRSRRAEADAGGGVGAAKEKKTHYRTCAISSPPLLTNRVPQPGGSNAPPRGVVARPGAKKPNWLRSPPTPVRASRKFFQVG